MELRKYLGVGILMEICYLSFYLMADGPEEVLLHIAVSIAAFLLLSVLLWKTRDDEVQTGMWILPLILGFGILFRLTLVPHTVVGSDDIYRYLWDGKVTASGENPYAHLPLDPGLAHLATPDLPARVNHPELRSVYPALAQVFFLVSHVLFGDSQGGMKLLLVLIDTSTIILLMQLLRMQGRPPRLAVIYAWSPLPVLYFGLDGHIDALAIFFLISAILLFLTGRQFRGGVALGFGALAKLLPLLAVPFLLREAKGIRRVSLIATPLVVVVVGSLLFYEPAWGVFESLGTFGSRWAFNGGVFMLGYWLTGSNEAAHLISTLEIGVLIGILMLLRRPVLEKVFWGFTGFILLAPVVHPWYLTWLAALLVLRWSLPVYLLIGLSFIPNIVVYQYRAFGEWQDQPLLLLLEYLPVAILLIRELTLSTRKAPAR